MNLLEFIKEYQTLIGSIVGSFLAIISSILLWSLKTRFEKRDRIRGDKQEVEKIFLMASRECQESIDNLKDFIDKSKEVIKSKTTEMNVILPAKFNKISINEERLFVLSKNFHHIISQQIDVAVSAAKKFNSWLEMYEEFPQIFYKYSIDALKANIKSRDEAIKSYQDDQERYISGIKNCLKNEVGIIQVHLLRPVIAMQNKDKDLEKMMFSGGLDKIMDNGAKYYLDLNNSI
jgi:hypothetical protein